MKLFLIITVYLTTSSHFIVAQQDLGEIEFTSQLEIELKYDYDYRDSKYDEANRTLSELKAKPLDDQFLHDEDNDDNFMEWNKCDNYLSQPRGVKKYVDTSFLKKFFRNLVPYAAQKLQMNFYLFKRAFPDCGREISLNDDSIYSCGLNASHPTRIIIHGWMSQSRGSFNLDVKNAYLKRGDYNVIVADWSAIAANINYFGVVRLIETFGGHLARFTKHLYEKGRVNYNDMYLIGHSLGAQIAGAAGKKSWPHRYNTIFALDPAGPKFRRRSTEFRINPTDAKYVESIQTSKNLGFMEPTGNATFYPNYGKYQRKCFYVGCSHIRAYRMFAESITSPTGFWGIRCRSRKPKWDCDSMNAQEYRMGGEPSQPKSGIFYVKTNSKSPFALGKISMDDMNS
ncbi:phospholipase A1-like [Musca autumnalis]|uniref:phospholipase A1-like n=1 Tax=Musca autumnalis TaxID=221902 RepID=UPI003CE912D6